MHMQASSPKSEGIPIGTRWFETRVWPRNFQQLVLKHRTYRAERCLAWAAVMVYHERTLSSPLSAFPQNVLWIKSWHLVEWELPPPRKSRLPSRLEQKNTETNLSEIHLSKGRSEAQKMDAFENFYWIFRSTIDLCTSFNCRVEIFTPKPCGRKSPNLTTNAHLFQMVKGGWKTTNNL